MRRDWTTLLVGLVCVGSIRCAATATLPPVDLEARRRSYVAEHDGADAKRDVAVDFALQVRLRTTAKPRWAGVLVDGELLTGGSTLLHAGRHEVEVMLGYPPAGPDGRLRPVSARRDVEVTTSGPQSFAFLVEISESGTTDGAPALVARLADPLRLGGPPVAARRLEASSVSLTTENDHEKHFRFALILAHCAADGTVEAVAFPWHENPGNAGRIVGAVGSWRYQPPPGSSKPFMVLDSIQRPD